MIKNDAWIRKHGPKIFRPFAAESVNKVSVRTSATPYRVLSYGTTSYGYDLRLSPKDFRVFERVPGQVVDPKMFDSSNLKSARLHVDGVGGGAYFILPGNSYGLGVALEHLHVPDDCIAIAIGKSTYARVGIICNVTPAEPGWRGHLTLEFSNSSPADCRIYADEGVCQLLFLGGEPCEHPYGKRSGKYADQPEKVVVAKV